MWWRRSWFSLKGTAGIQRSRRDPLSYAGLLPAATGGSMHHAVALSMTSAGRMLRHELRDFDYVCQHERFLDDCFHRASSDHREPQVLGHLRDRVRHHGDFVRGSGDYGRWTPLDRRGTWRGTLGAGTRLFARLARRLLWRHPHGTRSRAFRYPLHGHIRLGDDFGWIDRGAKWWPAKPASRVRPVCRPAGQCRYQRAALRLCHALVRPTPRHGVGLARQRFVGVRRDLGAAFRGHRGAYWLARHYAGFRSAAIRAGRAGGGAHFHQGARNRSTDGPPPWLEVGSPGAGA